MRSIVEQYKSGTSVTGKNTLATRKSNPPPSSESGPSRRQFAMIPKRSNFGKSTSSGESGKNKRNLSSQRISSS